MDALPLERISFNATQKKTEKINKHIQRNNKDIMIMLPMLLVELKNKNLHAKKRRRKISMRGLSII